MLLPLLRQFLLAAVGTLSFAVLFHVRPRDYLLCAIDGGVGWVCYWLLTAQGMDSMLATLFATLPLALLARVFAIRAKAPSTVFLLCGIFPLVPGAGIYYTAYYFIQNSRPQMAACAMEVCKVALALSLGISIVLGIPLPHQHSYGPQGEEKHGAS